MADSTIYGIAENKSLKEVYDKESTYSKTETDDLLNGKANSSHNHSAANITSGTLSSNRLPTIPITKGGTGATTAAAALANLGIKDYVVESYETETDLGNWYIQKWNSGKLVMESDGTFVVSLNYAASGNIFIGGYTLQFPVASTKQALINCMTLENSGVSFYATATAQDNKTKALVQFSKNSAGQAIRTQHSLEIIGRWK